MLKYVVFYFCFCFFDGLLIFLCLFIYWLHNQFCVLWKSYFCRNRNVDDDFIIFICIGTFLSSCPGSHHGHVSQFFRIQWYSFHCTVFAGLDVCCCTCLVHVGTYAAVFLSFCHCQHRIFIVDLYLIVDIRRDLCFTICGEGQMERTDTQDFLCFICQGIFDLLISHRVFYHWLYLQFSACRHLCLIRYSYGHCGLISFTGKYFLICVCSFTLCFTARFTLGFWFLFSACFWFALRLSRSLILLILSACNTTYYDGCARQNIHSGVGEYHSTCC